MADRHGDGQRARRRRGGALLRALAGLLAAAAVLSGVAVWQHSYALREETVSLQHAGRTLDGVLALPEKGEGPFGLVVFVHGDGPVDATHETFYRPIWESFARVGYASLSFSKPGVGGSGGDWLEQSMADRAEETLAAVAWARGRPEIDRDRIGLWGASQAGWVLPKVAAEDPSLRFAVAVSPAVNWQRQGRYNLLAELRERNAPKEEISAALHRRETTLELLRRGASHEEYRAELGDSADMTAARWGFAARNFTADATNDLRAVQGVPVLLVLAGHDVHVDVAETEAVYRSLLDPSLLRVAHYPGATHALLDEAVASWEPRLTATALLAPRRIFAPDFLADQARFVAQLPGERAT
ncbi:alpha/beta hydrolase family protein [Streptomyces sp. C10-9-1]|uniref:alpha/beta hydrolase family protein n=1 Tax=Streptomyces sp. C10-9-1 TaxID=1859285 RepID=UPI003D743399